MTDRRSEPPAERRLHPLSWMFGMLTQARGLVLPGLALLVTARFTNVDVLLVPAAFAILASVLIQQFSLRYVLGPHEIIVRRNLLVYRTERHIPYARIHNLRTSETPIHRWLGVVEVGVETAGGAEPEATFRVLSRDALAELRAYVAQGAAHVQSDAERPETSAGRVFLALSTRQLIVHGLLNNRGFVVAGAIAGVVWELTAAAQGGQPWDPRSWSAPWRVIRARGTDLVEMSSLVSPVWLVLWIATGIVLLVTLSIVWSLVTLHAFRVERTREGLTVEHGLFPRTATVIPYARIQRVVILEGPVHRLMGHVEVRLDTVGQGRKGKERAAGPVWLAPLAPRARLPALLAEVGAPFAIDTAQWQALHPRAARRMRTRALIVLLCAGALLWPMVGIWAIGAVAAASPMVLLAATRQAQRFAYAVSELVVVRSGWLLQTTHLTWIDRVQAVSVTASPFDRRHEMATLIVDLAAGGALDIPFLAASTARHEQQRLLREVAACEFSW